MPAYAVKLGDFEGPIELLLRLVEEKKMHISRVSLAAVADGFVAYLEKLEGRDKNQMANFILVASTLMLIKSLSLLPSMAISEEEKEDIKDLECRLRLYARLKELSGHVRAAYGRRRIFAREPRREMTPIFSPGRDLSVVSLAAALKRVIANLPAVEKLPRAVVQKVASLEEAIDDLVRRVRSALKISFQHLVKDKSEKVNVIVSFLGMLELVRRGIVQAEQSAHFEDITIEQAETVIPKYG